MGDLTWKLVPVESIDEMLRSACAVDFPALYRTHLRHPDNGPGGAAETEQKIATERRRWAAMLAASPPSPTLPSREGIEAAWNSIADEFNQWDDLSLDERDDFAKFAAALFTAPQPLAKQDKAL